MLTLSLRWSVGAAPCSRTLSGYGSVFLDRSALQNPRAHPVAPRPNHAPEIFFCRGGWLLDNRSDTETITLVDPAHKVLDLPPHMLRWLENGTSEVTAYGFTVVACVTGAASRELDDHDDVITQSTTASQVIAVQDILSREPLARGILAARFQAFYYPAAERMHLTAAETARCFPGIAEADVANLQARIFRRTGIPLKDLGDFLQLNDLITVSDVDDLPHAGCVHDWRQR